MSDPFRDPPGFALDPAANPFKPGIGKVPPAFGGRENSLGLAWVIVERLAVAVDPPFLLVRGVRGIGKTALLAYVRRQAVSRGVVCGHLEADRQLAAPEAIVRALLDDAAGILGEGPLSRVARRVDGVTVGPSGLNVSLGRDALDRSLQQTITAIGEAAADRGHGFLLTIDEVQEAEDDLFRPLIRSMHRVAQEDQPVGLIAAGLPGAARALQEEGQTYTERLDVVDLQLLDSDAVTDALLRPFKDAGLSVDTSVLAVVAREVGGYPYFVQVWGAALWDAATSPTALTLDAVPRARSLAAARIDRFYQSRARRVPTGRGRQIVTALASLHGSARVANLLSKAGLTNSQYGPAREQLLRLGIIHDPEWGQVAFSVPGFDKWLDRNPLS